MPRLSKLGLIADLPEPAPDLRDWTHHYVRVLLMGNSPGTFDAFREEEFDNIVLYHHTLGRYIRNTFEFWAPEQREVLESLCEGRPEVSPDEASTAVMEALWRRLRDRAEDPKGNAGS